MYTYEDYKNVENRVDLTIKSTLTSIITIYEQYNVWLIDDIEYLLKVLPEYMVKYQITTEEQDLTLTDSEQLALLKEATKNYDPLNITKEQIKDIAQIILTINTINFYMKNR